MIPLTFNTSDSERPRIGPHECAAIRSLDRAPGYPRSEIAFMFGCKEPTIARHADRECQHQERTDETVPAKGKYSNEDLLYFVRYVNQQTERDRVTVPAYNDARPDRFAAADTIRKRFGSWGEAVDRAKELKD